MNLNQSMAETGIGTPEDMTKGRKAQDFLRERLERRDNATPEQPVSDPTHNFQAPAMPPAYTERSPGTQGDNFGNSLNYAALNEAQFKHSQQNFNSIDRARNASAAAQETVRADDMFKGLRQATIDMSDYYQQRSRERTLNLFGDVWNVSGGPEWAAPDDPKEIKADLGQYEVDFD